MLIPWLEELEQNNSISKEAAAAIYKDCSDLVEASFEKTAGDEPEFLSGEEQADLFRGDTEGLLQYTNTAHTLASKREDKERLRTIAELERAMAQDQLAAAPIYERAEKNKAIAERAGAIGAKYNAAAKRLGFVEKGIQTIMGPFGGFVEKGTRPYRLSSKANSTGNFLDRAFHDSDIPKARARFEEILEIAPSLAQDPLTMQRVVANTLHSGLSRDEKNYLRQIQVSEGNTLWDMGRINQSMLKGREGAMKGRLKKALGKSAAIRADHLATVFEVIHEGIGGNEKVAAGSLDTSIQRVASTNASKYLKSGLNPTLGNVTANALKTLALVSSVPLIAGGLSGITRTVMDYKRKKDLDKSLKASYDYAMGGKDDASRELRDNRSKAESAFESLVHFAPDVATQKGAAKAFLYKMISVGGPDVGITSGDIKDLTDIQKNLTNSKGDHPFVAGFGAAGKLTGLSNITSSTISETTKPFTQQSAEMAEAHLSGPGFVNSL